MEEVGGCGGNLPSLGVSSPCQATMTELQEVQITEERPLLPGQTPEMAKVIQDPMTARPKFQTSKHHQIHNLILIHTPTFSTPPHGSLPIYYTTIGSPGLCHVTILILILSMSLFVISFCLWPLHLPLFLYVCLSICLSTLHGCVFLCGSVCVCLSLSRRLS